LPPEAGIRDQTTDKVAENAAARASMLAATGFDLSSAGVAMSGHSRLRSKMYALEDSGEEDVAVADAHGANERDATLSLSKQTPPRPPGKPMPNTASGASEAGTVSVRMRSHQESLESRSEPSDGSHRTAD